LSQSTSEEVESLIRRIQELEGEREALRIELWKLQRRPTRWVFYGLCGVGAVALVSSYFFNSTPLAFIGLGLTFWGILFFFASPVKYVKGELVDSTAISSLSAIDKLLTDLKYKGKGIYIAPQTLKGLKGCSVFIPAEAESAVPSLDKLVKGKVFIEDPKGACLVPTGLGLMFLFERELGVDFSKVDLDYLARELPRLIIEGLEIAEGFEFTAEKGRVHVKMINPIYGGFCREVKETTRICSRFGCPLCSSIACVLAKATGKNVVIDRTVLSEDGGMLDVWYSVFEVGG